MAPSQIKKTFPPKKNGNFFFGGGGGGGCLVVAWFYPRILFLFCLSRYVAVFTGLSELIVDIVNNNISVSNSSM